MEPMVIEPMAVARLRPYAGKARTHSRKQIRQIADSIQKFGFTNPVLIGEDDEIIAGHGRVEAAKLLGMESVPTLRLSHLDAAQRRAYVLADNQLALNAGWDQEVLAIELQALIDLDFGVEITGFSLAEVDLVLDEARESSPDPGRDVGPAWRAPSWSNDEFLPDLRSLGRGAQESLANRRRWSIFAWGRPRAFVLRSRRLSNRRRDALRLEENISDQGGDRHRRGLCLVRPRAFCSARLR